MTRHRFGTYPTWPSGGSWFAALEVSASAVELHPKVHGMTRRLALDDVRLVVPVGLVGAPAWVGFVAPGARHNGMRFGTLFEQRLLGDLEVLGYPVDRTRVGMDRFRDLCGERFLPRWRSSPPLPDERVDVDRARNRRVGCGRIAAQHSQRASTRWSRRFACAAIGS